MSQIPPDFVPVAIGAPPDAKPPSWEWVKLLDVAELESGHTPRKSVPAYWENGDIPWLSLRDIRAVHGKTTSETELAATSLGIDNSSARVLPAGTVCLSRDISVGFVTIMGREMATSQHFANWICEEALDNRFLMFAFMASRDRLIQSGEGTTVRTIYMPALKQMQICVPPLAEQRRIVSKIQLLQEQSSRATRALSEVGPLLEQFRQSVLRAAFSGRLTSDWRAAHRDVDPATELLSRIRTERRHRWEQSELAKYEAKGKKPPKNWQQRYKEPEPVDDSTLPPLPDSWYWVTIDTIANKVSDGVHKKPNYVESGVPFLSVKNLTAGSGISFEDIKYVTQEDHDDFIRRTHPEKGDILVTKDGTLGVIRLIDVDTVFSIFVSLALIKTVFPDISPFIARMLEAPQGQAGMKTTGTGLQHIHLVDLRATVVPLAPPEEQDEIIRRVEERMSCEASVSDALAESESALTQLDQSIIAKAFRGELVSQDPHDDPIRTSIVNVIKTREERASKPQIRKSPVTKPAPASDQLVSWVAKTKRKSFSFDDLRADIRVNYDEFRDAIFDLLTDKKSGFEQYFDEAERAMRFRKAAK